MNTSTCVKYLQYVSHECERYLRDGRVTDEELVDLVIEFERFQEQVGESDLPSEIKSGIGELEFDYSIKRIERGTWFLVVAFLTFGSWAIFLSWQKQAKRKEVLRLLKFDASRLSTFIQLNY